MFILLFIHRAMDHVHVLRSRLSLDEHKRPPANQTSGGVKYIISFILVLFVLGIIAHLTTVDKISRLKFGNNSELTREQNLFDLIRSNFLVLKDPKVKRLPQVIIIGSRKCGTRALLKFLELNPLIRPAHNEIHFFDKPQNYVLGLDWYRRQMPESYENETTIEKSPAYFVTNGVAEMIKSMNSSIKLVLIFRDPTIRLISDFSQIISNKIEARAVDESLDSEYDEYVSSKVNLNVNQTEKAWKDAAAEFERYVLRPDGGINDQRSAVKTGMYSIYLERWKAVFPANQFHYVDGEALIKDPYPEMHKLEVFLGLNPTIKPSNFQFSPRKGFFCISLSPSNMDSPQSDTENKSYVNITHLSQNENHINYNNWKHSIFEPDAITTKTDEDGSIKLSCLSKSKGRRHVEVKKELVEKLRKFYAPYNQYLFSLIGMNFYWPTSD